METVKDGGQGERISAFHAPKALPAEQERAWSAGADRITFFLDMGTVLIYTRSNLKKDICVLY